MSDGSTYVFRVLNANASKPSEGNEKTANANLLGIQVISKFGLNVKANYEGLNFINEI